MARPNTDIKEIVVPTYMYHELDAPEGEVFSASEVPSLERKGWVDTPAKFGKVYDFVSVSAS